MGFMCSEADRKLITIAGILGENLIIPERITKDVTGFVVVNLTTLGVCLLFFTGLMVYIRYRRLM